MNNLNCPYSDSESVVAGVTNDLNYTFTVLEDDSYLHNRMRQACKTAKQHKKRSADDSTKKVNTTKRMRLGRPNRGVQSEVVPNCSSTTGDTASAKCQRERSSDPQTTRMDRTHKRRRSPVCVDDTIPTKSAKPSFETSRTSYHKESIACDEYRKSASTVTEKEMVTESKRLSTTTTPKQTRRRKVAKGTLTDVLRRDTATFWRNEDIYPSTSFSGSTDVHTLSKKNIDCEITSCYVSDMDSGKEKHGTKDLNSLLVSSVRKDETGHNSDGSSSFESLQLNGKCCVEDFGAIIRNLALRRSARRQFIRSQVAV